MDPFTIVVGGIIVAVVGVLCASATYESLFTPSGVRYRPYDTEEPALRPSAASQSTVAKLPVGPDAPVVPVAPPVAPAVVVSLTNLASALGEAPGTPPVPPAQPPIPETARETDAQRDHESQKPRTGL